MVKNDKGLEVVICLCSTTRTALVTSALGKRPSESCPCVDCSLSSEGHSTSIHEPSDAQTDLQAVSLLDVLPYCSAELGLQGLACLSASSSSSSRTFEEACLDVARRDACTLLTSGPDAVFAAALHSPPAVKQQHLQAAAWLLRLVPSAATAAAEITEHLLQIPAMQEEWALPLVEAGARISYAQLLAAAEGLLSGVEEWVCAQQQLGVVTDIPAAAVAICCGHPAMFQLTVRAVI
jgi:hypothetical protein